MEYAAYRQVADCQEYLAAATQKMDQEDYRMVLNEKEKAEELSSDEFDPSDIGDYVELWEDFMESIPTPDFAKKFYNEPSPV